ncbi:ATP-dependent acyl-CoA ligase [Rhodococcus rhodochrous]|uniref:ATP-dependent acyl-CoA ligase n=2 Tax=Rhodococcus rhodochrous TaxID=1829 RepID=UPI000AB69033|nr:ATP-dependent acyl-CoA ligase [Rhodococcus rhodochrous]
MNSNRFPDDLSPTDMTLPGMLSLRARLTPHAPTLIFGETRRTAAEMREAVARTGHMLHSHGVHRGDRVALMSSNRIELLDLILGCAWIGAVAVPINTAARGTQLHQVLSNSQARLLVIESALIEHVQAIAPLEDLTDVWLIDSRPGHDDLPWRTLSLPTATEQIDPIRPELGDPAVILYTSGTTGVSKGVVCPHAQFYWWGRNVTAQLGITSEDTLYTCLPLFHTNALNAFSQALVAGACYAVGPRFSASRFWVDAAQNNATFTYLLGAMVSILCSKPESSADRAHNVRAALSPATPAKLLTAFRERFGVTLIDGYGSTETNAIISSSRTEQRAGYMGRIQPGFVARVVDEHGLEVEPGTPGELLLRSEQPFAFASGYFRMPEATVEAWQDLWFHTGDRVAIDADGWVRFVDRIKDVIRRRGENISSVEVEQALRLHPNIDDAAVFAVESELGEDEVMAAVVVEPGVRLDFEEVTAFCEPRLAYFAIPRFFSVHQALPLTENGKVNKNVLRKLGAGAAAWDRESARIRVSAP